MPSVTDRGSNLKLVHYVLRLPLVANTSATITAGIHVPTTKAERLDTFGSAPFLGRSFTFASTWVVYSILYDVLLYQHSKRRTPQPRYQLHHYYSVFASIVLQCVVRQIRQTTHELACRRGIGWLGLHTYVPYSFDLHGLKHGYSKSKLPAAPYHPIQFGCGWV